MNSYNSHAQEICNNGKDDDGDGLIDLHDPDCQCHYTVTGNLLQNGSFESYDHCPLNYTYDADYKIADYWQFGTYVNISEAVYYHNLLCSYDSAQVMLNMPPEQPIPDGNAFISIQNTTYSTAIPEPQIPKTYVGQCLQAPLQKGENYTLSFYAGRFKSWDNLTGKVFPYTVAMFGNTDCNAVPFGKEFVSGNGCPANYPGWILLGETKVYNSEQWVQNRISFNAPDNISIIEIGPDCSVLASINDQADSTTFLDYHQYYLDDLHLLPTKDFPFEYITLQAENTCTDLPILQSPVYTNATYQWYKDSIAIIGATSAVYKISDTAGSHYYNVIITTSSKCITAEPFLITSTKLNEVKIPQDSFLCDKTPLLLSPSLPGISYTVNGLKTDAVTITNAGNYTIVASDEYGCKKIFNTNITDQNCAECIVFIPTAFTPNNDGLNDVFKPKLDCAPAAFHIKIFDRWGEKIFESTNINKGWDGNYLGKKLSTGAYVYFIDYKTISGTAKTIKGMLTLLQ
jgi:gliding motility-associated-like protein